MTAGATCPNGAWLIFAGFLWKPAAIRSTLWPVCSIWTNLLERIADDIFLRSRKRINGQRPVRYESFYLLREALLRGSFPRGEASRITGLAERTARMVLRRLTDERLLVSDTPKGHVRMGFPAAAACRWFDMP